MKVTRMAQSLPRQGYGICRFCWKGGPHLARPSPAWYGVDLSRSPGHGNHLSSFDDDAWSLYLNTPGLLSPHSHSSLGQMKCVDIL